MTIYKKKTLKLRTLTSLVGFVFIACMLTPLVALAAQESTPAQTWWQSLLLPILSVVGMAVAAFLTAGLRKLVKLIETKWKVDIPDSIEKLMTEKARWTLAWVEEKAEKRLLHGDGEKTPGAQKIFEVVAILDRFAIENGYGKEWQRDKLEALAEGILHLERDKTIGSNGDRAAKLKEKKADKAEK